MTIRAGAGLRRHAGGQPGGRARRRQGWRRLGGVARVGCQALLWRRTGSGLGRCFAEEAPPGGNRCLRGLGGFIQAMLRVIIIQFSIFCRLVLKARPHTASSHPDPALRRPGRGGGELLLLDPPSAAGQGASAGGLRTGIGWLPHPSLLQQQPGFPPSTAACESVNQPVRHPPSCATGG